MKRSPGSTEGLLTRFQRARAIAAVTAITKLSAKTYLLPTLEITSPATSGPATREKLTATALSASAGESWSRETSSGMIAAYTGHRIASPMPFMKTSISRMIGRSASAAATR